MPDTTTLPVRLGCDLEQVSHVADAIRDFGDRYLDRVYTASEQNALVAGGTASLAGRFAAKEAVLKLIGQGGEIGDIDLRCVEVTNRPGGRPVVRLSGRAADVARLAGIGPIDISISHAGPMAMAVAVAATQDPTPLTPGVPVDPDQ